jgi:hypothetical protein
MSPVPQHVRDAGARPDPLADQLERIERKLDQVLEFRDFVMSFATGGKAKVLAALAKAKLGGG